MKRVQRKRTKGFRLPPKTKCINRGTDWGNPFKVIKKGDGWLALYYHSDNVGVFVPKKEYAIRLSINWYRKYLLTQIERGTLSLSDFDGYDHIACFCPVDQPCHGDVIINLLKNKN